MKSSARLACLVPVMALGFLAHPLQARQSGGAGVPEAEARALFPARVDVAVIEGISGPGADTTRSDQAAGLAGKQLHLSEVPAVDVGEWLRLLPGVGAVRRGGLGFDPSIRGLSEANVNVYVDGVPALAGGPLRADSQVSHVDPGAVDRIEVVKGPYALTWGAGNLSAIRIEQGLEAPVPGVHGMAQVGYRTNLGALETAGAVTGRGNRWMYGLQGAYRAGGDYTTGDGMGVESSYRSAAIQARAAYQPAPGQQLAVTGRYDTRRQVDFPGLVLDLKQMDSGTVSARYRYAQEAGRLQRLEVLAFTTASESGMDNDGKATALPDPARAWPFPLLITADATVQQVGGRAAADLLVSSAQTITLGADFQGTRWRANRRIERRDEEALLEASWIWPDARNADLGFFAGSTLRVGRLRASGTVRLDQVWADADPDLIDDFFFRKAGRRALEPEDLARTEAHVSLAGTLEFLLSDEASLGVGLGSAARTATVLERYGDRFPISRSHSEAEVIGHPFIEPERATEVDVSGRVVYPRWWVQGNVYGRLMSDFLFLYASGLNNRLPISPGAVYRYLSGEGRYYGFEVEGACAIGEPLVVDFSASYSYGGVQRHSEPVFGVPPARAALGLRYEPSGGRFFAGGRAYLTGAQERVELPSNEARTDGYLTLDVRVGGRVRPDVLLIAGINNVFDAAYAYHLNARDAFTRDQLMEPGRNLFASARFTF